MPAIVTTPVAITVNTRFTPAALNATAIFRPLKGAVIPPVAVTAPARFAPGMALRRWNGTAWVTLYRPTT